MEQNSRVMNRRSGSLCRFGLALVLGACSLVAQAMPQDVLFIFDNADGMKAADPHLDSVAMARDFLAKLGPERRVGVLVFDDKVALTAALNKPEQLAKALDTANYRGSLANSPAAIERALYELKTNGRPEATKAIVFMTHSGVETGNPALDADRARWLRDELSKDAAALKVQIFGLAVTEAADIQLLDALAEPTGGRYERAYAVPELPGAFSKVLMALNGELPIGDVNAAAAKLSPEERASLEQLSRDTGVPMAQLLKELAAGDHTDPKVLAGAQPTAPVVTGANPPPAPTPVAQNPALPPPSVDQQGGMGGLFAALAALLVAGAGWFVFKRKSAANTSSASTAPIAAATTSGVAAAATAKSVAPAMTPEGKVPEGWLIDIEGHAGLPPFRLTGKPLMVGRVRGEDAAHLDYYVIDKPTVGRSHAVIKYRDRHFWLLEQGSVNGTFVNGQRITGEHRLRNGDRLKFHKFEFEFQHPGTAVGGEGTLVGAAFDQTLVASADATLVASASELAAALVKSAPEAGVTLRAVPPPADMDATMMTPALGMEATMMAPAGLSLARSTPSPASDSAGDMFDDVLAVSPLAAAPSHDFFAAEAAAAPVDLMAQTLPPVGGDLLDETAAPSLTALDAPLAETFLRSAPDAFDADASAFFDDFTMRPAGAAPDPDFDPLDSTAPPMAAAGDSDFSNKDFYTATTIIPAARPPAELLEDTTQFTATAVISAAELQQSLASGGAPPADMPEENPQFTATAVISAAELQRSLAAGAPPSASPPLAVAPAGKGDDFFDIDLPIPPLADPVAHANALDDFGMDEPVIDLPEETSDPFALSVALDESLEAPPLNEETIVLPSSPLRTPRNPD